MSYVKNNWANGDTITADKLNHLEQGVFNATAYDVPFSVTNPGTEEQTCTTDADYDAVLAAVQAKRIVRVVITMEIEPGVMNTVYLPVHGVTISEGESSIGFSFVVNMGGPTYVELAWNGEDDPRLSFTPLGS